MAITAQVIVDRMQQKLGSGWKDSPVDTFLAGNSGSEVKGIVTTYAPSLEVLRKAVASGTNMIISRESPFWARTSGPGGGTQFTGLPGTWPGGPSFAGRGAQPMDGDPTYRAKRDYIAANNLDRVPALRELECAPAGRATAGTGQGDGLGEVLQTVGWRTVGN